MSDLYKFGYTLYETIKTMRDVIDTGNYDRMFLDTYYWLKMLSEYREIGTVEECREAVKKQKPKQVIIKEWSPTHCPTCNYELSHSVGDGYYKHPTFLKRCPECGQIIRWNKKTGEQNE